MDAILQRLESTNASEAMKHIYLWLNAPMLVKYTKPEIGEFFVNPDQNDTADISRNDTGLSLPNDTLPGNGTYPVNFEKEMKSFWWPSLAAQLIWIGLIILIILLSGYLLYCLSRYKRGQTNQGTIRVSYSASGSASAIVPRAIELSRAENPFGLGKRPRAPTPPTAIASLSNTMMVPSPPTFGSNDSIATVATLAADDMSFPPPPSPYHFDITALPTYSRSIAKPTRQAPPPPYPNYQDMSLSPFQSTPIQSTQNQIAQDPLPILLPLHPFYKNQSIPLPKIPEDSTPTLDSTSDNLGPAFTPKDVFGK